MQSNREQSGPFHVAIIMDGNGRWARARGMPRCVGHERGAGRLEEVLEAAGELGVGVLTLYAFSSDNWKRPCSEVTALMTLFERFLQDQAEACRRKGVRIQVIGRRDRLAPPLLAAIRSAESATRQAPDLLLRVAIDYSARWAIRSAAALATESDRSVAGFRKALASAVRALSRAPYAAAEPVGRARAVCRQANGRHKARRPAWLPEATNR